MRNKWVRGIVAMFAMICVGYAAYIFPRHSHAIWSFAIAVVASAVLGQSVFDFIWKGTRPVSRKEPEVKLYEQEDIKVDEGSIRGTQSPDLVRNLTGMNLYR